MYEDYRLVLLDKDGAFQKGFGELPYRDEEERKVNGMIRSEIYQGELTVSPSGNKVAHALQKADMIYFYDIAADGSLIMKSEQLKSYPQYRYDAGIIERDSPLYYMSICSTEEYVYTLYSGRNYKDDKDINFYINSPGGSVTAGMAIYDTMQYIKCDVSTICIGMAASMGAFLLAAGAKGKRLALPNSEIMIHQPLGGAQGQATEIKIAAEHILKTKDKLNKILSANTGKDLNIIEKDTDRDNFMTSNEALNYGIIDKIISKKVR